MQKFRFLAFVLFLSLLPTLANSGVKFIVEGNNAQPVKKPCSGYNLTSCPDGMVGSNFCPTSKKYFKSCVCNKDKFLYDKNNCTENRSLTGKSCGGKREKCECNAKVYKYNESNCIQPKSLTGKSCNNKYEACKCSEEYSQRCSGKFIGGSESCNNRYTHCLCNRIYKVCKDGPLKNAEKCEESSSGLVKYSGCNEDKEPKTCKDAKLLSEKPKNQNCNEVLLQNKLTCYSNCKPITK